MSVSAALRGIVIQPSLGGSFQWIYWSPNGWMAIPIWWENHRTSAKIHRTFPSEIPIVHIKFIELSPLNWWNSCPSWKITLFSPWKITKFFAEPPDPPKTTINPTIHCHLRARPRRHHRWHRPGIRGQGRAAPPPGDSVGRLHGKFGDFEWKKWWYQRVFFDGYVMWMYIHQELGFLSKNWS